jgi:putative transposase
MIYQFVDDHRTEYAVTRLCRTLGVSPSGYYAWRQRPPSTRAEANQRLVTHMRLIHHEVHETYGSPRMHTELVARGLSCNVKRVARLMRLHHLRARHKRRYRVTTKASPKLPVAPNHLAQHFQASAPNEKWVSDITYIWTREGWLYLAVVMDLYSRRIIGWALARTQETTLVLAGLAHGHWPPPTTSWPAASF